METQLVQPMQQMQPMPTHIPRSEKAKGKQGIGDPGVPKRTRWCLSCKRKKLLWSIKKKAFHCMNCKELIRADKYRELAQDASIKLKRVRT